MIPLESIWRSSATKDQINDMTELLNLAMATPEQRKHYEESARWAEDMAASASDGYGEGGGESCFGRC